MQIILQLNSNPADIKNMPSFFRFNISFKKNNKFVIFYTPVPK